MGHTKIYTINEYYRTMKITLFWLAGSGTSTVGKLLAKKMQLNFMSSWNILRSWAKDEGYASIYEFEDKVAKHDTTFDIKLDNKVAEYGKNEDNFIFESRLAWHFIPESIKIYLDCEESERYRRIFQREGWEKQNIIDQNTKRETELVHRYNDVYPDILFPPQEEDFDIYIDGTDILPEQIVEQIMNQIK